LYKGKTVIWQTQGSQSQRRSCSLAPVLHLQIRRRPHHPSPLLSLSLSLSTRRRLDLPGARPHTPPVPAPLRVPFPSRHSRSPPPARLTSTSPLPSRAIPQARVCLAAATGLRSVRRDGVWRVRGGGGGGGPRGGASGGRGGAGGAGASRAGGRGGVRAHDEEGQELPPAQAPGARQVLRAGGITCSAPPPLVWFWFR
jgi:hypothetical protein